MKLKVLANQIIDGEIDFVSLVKHGANRTGFKIVKEDERNPADNFWAGLLPELDKVGQRLSKDQPPDSEARHMTKSSIQKTEQQVQDRERETLEHTLAGLHDQFYRVLENPTNPLFERLLDDLTFRITKCELALAGLRDDSEEMNKRSAFIRRGGTSIHSVATVSDSAYERNHDELRKAESEVSLETQMTRTEPEEVEKIDLNDLVL